MADKKAILWVEVTCMHCGATIGVDYRNADSIRNLKRAVKDWRYCGAEGNLCPECYRKYKKGE